MPGGPGPDPAGRAGHGAARARARAVPSVAPAAQDRARRTGRSWRVTRGNVVATPTWRRASQRHIGQLRHYAGQLNARLPGAAPGQRASLIVNRLEALVRAVLWLRQYLPARPAVIPVPLAPRHARRDPDATDLRAQGIVAAAYGATHLLSELHRT